MEEIFRNILFNYLKSVILGGDLKIKFFFKIYVNQPQIFMMTFSKEKKLTQLRNIYVYNEVYT